MTADEIIKSPKVVLWRAAATPLILTMLIAASIVSGSLILLAAASGTLSWPILGVIASAGTIAAVPILYIRSATKRIRRRQEEVHQEEVHQEKREPKVSTITDYLLSGLGWFVAVIVVAGTFFSGAVGVAHLSTLAGSLNLSFIPIVLYPEIILGMGICNAVTQYFFTGLSVRRFFSRTIPNYLSGNSGGTEVAKYKLQHPIQMRIIMLSAGLSSLAWGSFVALVFAAFLTLPFISLTLPLWLTSLGCLTIGLSFFLGAFKAYVDVVNGLINDGKMQNFVAPKSVMGGLKFFGTLLIFGGGAALGNYLSANAGVHHIFDMLNSSLHVFASTPILGIEKVALWVFGLAAIAASFLVTGSIARSFYINPRKSQDNRTTTKEVVLGYIKDIALGPVNNLRSGIAVWKNWVRSENKQPLEWFNGEWVKRRRIDGTHYVFKQINDQWVKHKLHNGEWTSCEEIQAKLLQTASESSRSRVDSTGSTYKQLSPKTIVTAAESVEIAKRSNFVAVTKSLDKLTIPQGSRARRYSSPPDSPTSQLAYKYASELEQQEQNKLGQRRNSHSYFIPHKLDFDEEASESPRASNTPREILSL